MASEHDTSAEKTKPLEDEIADLNLQEKAGLVTEAAREYVDGANEATASLFVAEVQKDLCEGTKDSLDVVGKDEKKSSEEAPSQEEEVCSATEVKKDLCEAAEESSDVVDKDEKSFDEATSREVNLAKEEAAKSADESAYVVPTVDHRAIAQPGGEEKKVDVPTGIVHENADVIEKSQQGKGLIQTVTGKISQSVKTVFSGLTGGKAPKNEEPKGKEMTE